MYKLIKKIDAGIWYEPVVYKGMLFVNEKDKTVSAFDPNTFEKVMQFPQDDLSYITVKKDKLFLSRRTGTFLWNGKQDAEEALFLPRVTVLPSYVTDQYIFSNYQTETGLKVGKYDYKKNQLIKLFDYQIGREVKGFGNKLIFEEKELFAQNIFCIDRDSGELCWKLDVRKLYEPFSNEKEAETRLTSSLMMKNDAVFVTDSNNTLLKIDVNTGNLLWNKDKTNYLLQIHKSQLVNINILYHREISTETGKTLVEHEMKSEYDKHGFIITGPLGAFTVTNTHVFIVHAMGCTLGCINRKTGKIDWSVEVGNGKVSLPHSPVIYKDKLFVVDDVGTLHIYEQE